MPKRKYERLNEGQSGLNHRDGTFQAQQDRLEALVEHGKKSLFRALKVARGFERQKLGRRQKVAHESNFAAEEARLIAEVKALKVKEPRPSIFESLLTLCRVLTLLS